MPLALLVDRDADTRQMYAELLRQSAYETEEAADGPEGLAKAIAHHPAVIVTEARLPRMSGLEMCRMIRSDAVTQSIPIIVVTGDSLESTVKLAQSAGADAVLVKPCLPERLLAEIQAVIARAQELKERSRALHERSVAQIARSNELIERLHENRRVMLSHVHQRRATCDPPLMPPSLVCPACDRPLRYVSSHIGGVSERHAEQWDYFECSVCRDVFEYRQRTRKLRPYPFDVAGLSRHGQ